MAYAVYYRNELNCVFEDLDEAKDFIFQNYVASQSGEVTLKKAAKIIKEINDYCCIGEDYLIEGIDYYKKGEFNYGD